MSVRFAIIGSGYMGETYAECLRTQVPSGRLIAVAAGSRAKGLAERYGAQLEPSEEDVFGRSDVDAVILATPHSTHLPLTVAAADASKHVFVEKPMALTVMECDLMLAAARRAGVILAVNAVTRYRDSPLTAKRLIDDGRIGDVRMIRVLSSTVGYHMPDKGWLSDPGEGSVWLDWGAHGCDALRWLTGSEGELVFGHFTNYAPSRVTGLSGMVQLRFRSGVMAQLLMSFEIPPPGLGSSSQYLIIGSRGIVDCDAYGKVRLGAGDRWQEVFEQPAFDFIRDPMSPARLKGFAAQIQEFAECVLHGGRPGVTGEDGRASIELIEAAELSSGSGEAVRLPLQAAVFDRGQPPPGS